MLKIVQPTRLEIHNFGGSRRKRTMGISATSAISTAAARLRPNANFSREGTRLARKSHTTRMSERPKPTYTPVRNATSCKAGLELGSSRVESGGANGMGDGLLVIRSLLKPTIRRMVARFRKSFTPFRGEAEANREVRRPNQKRVRAMVARFLPWPRC